MDAVIAEVMRGGRVESVHEGAAIVVDSSGSVVFEVGDVARPTFPRSSVKALLALPLVETGAASRLGLTDSELALACASHTGEREHAQTAAMMLARVGQTVECLECGTHWPTLDEASRDLAKTGENPTALHNNCSGKHAGFICLGCDQGDDIRGYVSPDHPVMRRVTSALAEMTGTPHNETNRGVDGCSIPTYAIPLKALAYGFARFGTGHGLSPDRADAAKTLRNAVASAPFMVAGSGRFDTTVMQSLGEKVFCKMGAEGIMIASLPDQGLGIAVKCRDGSIRAAETAIAALMVRFGSEEISSDTALNNYVSQPIKNWNGIEVGQIRAARALGL